MSTAIIGITMSRSLSTYGYSQLSITEAYVQALLRAGACPVMIPLGATEKSLLNLLPKLDGILFSGGGDVQPEIYGSLPHPLVDEVDRDRDRVEIWLIQEAIERNLPFLGICRGLQVINVALGGTLFEDVFDQRPESIKHRYFPDMPRQYLAHQVDIEPGSRLSQILGMTRAPVNSLHHQGIRQLATVLAASAQAPDGLIEAIEVPGHRFGLAVQWHPEWLPPEASMDALFQDFITAAGA
jgi:putative glutamine amidotransferase